MALHLTGALGLKVGNRRKWSLARPVAASSAVLIVIAAMFVMVAIYGAHLLSRHVHLSDHTRAFSAALVLNETVSDLDDLRTAATAFAANGSWTQRDELQRRLRTVAARIDQFGGEAFRDVTSDHITFEPLMRQLRPAVAGAEADLRGEGDSSSVPTLLAAVRQTTPELLRAASRLHAAIQTSDTDRHRTLQQDHWTLVGILVALVSSGFLLMVMLARHSRLLSSAHGELDVVVDHLRKTGNELRTQNARFEAALTNMSQALCVVDSEQRLVVCNPRLNELFGLTEADTRPGTPVAQMFAAIPVAGQIDQAAVAAIQAEQRQLIASNQAGGFTQETQDGRALAVSHQAMPGGGWVATYEDVTDRRQAEARIRFVARHDGLTGLPNRAALIERLVTMLGHPRRDEDLAILTLNLDHFRTINDALGHDAGDRVLRAAADRLRQAVRESDVVARIGNDEFVVLQLSDQHPADAELLARRMLEALAEPFVIDNQRLSVTASIGIAIATEADTDPNLLLTHSDTSLDRAKAEGRDTYRFFDPEIDARSQARRSMEHELREAMARGDFILLYQPIWDLATDRVIGFEALLRWMHPERGMVSPGDFIPLAEELGLIGTIGAWVIGQACQDSAQWPEAFSVSVNLSAAQFQGDRLEATVDQALAHAGLSPRRLILEITESVLLHNDPRIVATLHRLRARGVRIALDDFGTGYSSLSYLVSFPFDKLKIDQSFVREMTTRPDCRTIVNSIVTLASQLGIATTAEGVETLEHLALIRAAGCADAQGFYFSKPEPASEIRRWFEPVSQD